jgi:hypothetical protein
LFIRDIKTEREVAVQKAILSSYNAVWRWLVCTNCPKTRHIALAGAVQCAQPEYVLGFTLKGFIIICLIRDIPLNPIFQEEILCFSSYRLATVISMEKHKNTKFSCWINSWRLQLYPQNKQS